VAAVLRSSVPVPSRRVEREAHDASVRAREIVASARAEAAVIVGGAEAEAEALRAAAAEAGRREGLARAAAVQLEVAAARERRLRAVERELVALAVDIARAVLGRELRDPDAVADVAASALASARARRQVTLRVHPSGAAALRAASGRLARLVPRAAGVVIEEDAGLAPGDVIVVTEGGQLDGRIESQLDVLRAAIEATL
jgi:flagellar biosynthesis/type III secretory pathway protein FliH